jgi:transposase
MVDHSTKVAGIDTSKAELAVCLLPDEIRFAVANDEVGIAVLVERCRETEIERAGIEATSIYHKKAAAALRAAGIAVAELQPRRGASPRRCSSAPRATTSTPM